MPFDPEDLRRTREEDMKNTSLPPSMWGILPADAPDGESVLDDDYNDSLDFDRFCQYCDAEPTNGEYPQVGELTMHMAAVHPDVYEEKRRLHYLHPDGSTPGYTEGQE